MSGPYHKPTKLYNVLKFVQDDYTLDFRVSSFPVKILKELKNRLSVPDLGSKNGPQILDFQRNSCLQIIFFYLEKFGKLDFF